VQEDHKAADRTDNRPERRQVEKPEIFCAVGEECGRYHEDGGHDEIAHADDKGGTLRPFLDLPDPFFDKRVIALFRDHKEDRRF
jgi:hypothetical protein